MAEINSANYVTVCGWMLQDLHLKGNELLIYAIIYGFSQDRKSAFFGDQEYLANWANCSERTVIRVLDALTHKGLLKANDIPGPGKRKSYRAVVESDKMSHSKGQNVTSEVTECHIESDKMSLPYIGNDKKDYISNDIPMRDAQPDAQEALFDRFWSAYPNKKDKARARKAWEKLKADAALTEVIMAALERQKKSRQWMKDNGEYIPHPSTWLNGRRWEDQVQTAAVRDRGYATNEVSDDDLDRLLQDFGEDI